MVGTHSGNGKATQQALRVRGAIPRVHAWTGPPGTRWPHSLRRSALLGRGSPAGPTRWIKLSQQDLVMIMHAASPTQPANLWQGNTPLQRLFCFPSVSTDQEPRIPVSYRPIGLLVRQLTDLFPGHRILSTASSVELRGNRPASSSLPRPPPLLHPPSLVGGGFISRPTVQLSRRIAYSRPFVHVISISPRWRIPWHLTWRTLGPRTPSVIASRHLTGSRAEKKSLNASIYRERSGVQCSFPGPSKRH